MTDFKIKPQYKENTKVVYDDHASENKYVIWQPYVYDLAFSLARKNGYSDILDIGCGSARKLSLVMAEFNITGVDFGANLTRCKAEYPICRWVDANLEEGLKFELSKNTVVICSDVVEHLLDPNPLMEDLRRFLNAGSIIVLSTPSRKPRSNGPPNKHHVREWSLEEFIEYVSVFLPISWSGVTKSNSTPASSWSTSLIVCSKDIEDIDVPEELGR